MARAGDPAHEGNENTGTRAASHDISTLRTGVSKAGAVRDYATRRGNHTHKCETTNAGRQGGVNLGCVRGVCCQGRRAAVRDRKPEEKNWGRSEFRPEKRALKARSLTSTDSCCRPECCDEADPGATSMSARARPTRLGTQRSRFTEKTHAGNTKSAPSCTSGRPCGTP